MTKTSTACESRATELELYIDGHCAHCRRFGRTIERLDGRGRIRIVSFRHNRDYLERGLSEQALVERMHAHAPATRHTVAGFEAVRAVCRALPPLRPLLLPLWLLALMKLGDRLYDLLARHRLIVPTPEACASGRCALGARPRPPRRRALAATAAGITLLLTWHFAATLVHIMPLSSLGVMFRDSVNGYIYPLFTQRWSLFAPEPPTQNARLNVQCRWADGKPTPWLDTDQELARNHARFRLTPSAYLLRVNRAALAGAVGVQDEALDELMAKVDKISPREQEYLKLALRDKALDKLADQRFLYRLIEHHCRQAGDQPLAATRARVIFETIPKFSKRNDPSPDMNAREVVFEWVNAGTIDQYLVAKREEIVKAFEQVKLEDLKKLKPL